MKEETPKCFSNEELKQLPKLAESATRYSMRENGIKEQAGVSGKKPGTQAN